MCVSVIKSVCVYYEAASWGCFRSRGFTQLRVLFYLAATFVLLLTAKIVLHFIPITSSSEQFSQSFATRPLAKIPMISQDVRTATQLFTKTLAEHFRKYRMMKSLEKINRCVSLVF